LGERISIDYCYLTRVALDSLDVMNKSIQVASNAESLSPLCVLFMHPFFSFLQLSAR
jgi:hypothetical protein